MLNSNFIYVFKYVLRRKVIVSATLGILLCFNSINSLAQNSYFDSSQVFNWDDKNVTINDLPKKKLYVFHYSQSLDKKMVDSVELLRRNNYINFCLLFDKNTNAIKLKELEKDLPIYLLKRTGKQKNNNDLFILTNSRYEIVVQTNSFVALVKYLEEYYMINDGINIEPK